VDFATALAVNEAAKGGRSPQAVHSTIVVPRLSAESDTWRNAQATLRPTATPRAPPPPPPPPLPPSPLRVDRSTAGARALAAAAAAVPLSPPPTPLRKPPPPAATVPSRRLRRV